MLVYRGVIRNISFHFVQKYMCVILSLPLFLFSHPLLRQKYKIFPFHFSSNFHPRKSIAQAERLFLVFACLGSSVLFINLLSFSFTDRNSHPNSHISPSIASSSVSPFYCHSIWKRGGWGGDPHKAYGRWIKIHTQNWNWSMQKEHFEVQNYWT